MAFIVGAVGSAANCFDLLKRVRVLKARDSFRLVFPVAHFSHLFFGSFSSSNTFFL